MNSLPITLDLGMFLISHRCFSVDMTDNKNMLKGKCRAILDTEDKVTRYSKRVDLRRWIKDKNTEITMKMILEMDYWELGIFMVCGAGGDFYNYARRLREDRYMDIPKKAEDQPTDKTPSSEIKPSPDGTQGFEQLDPDLILSMVNNSSDDCLLDISEWIVGEMNSRQKGGS